MLILFLLRLVFVGNGYRFFSLNHTFTCCFRFTRTKQKNLLRTSLKGNHPWVADDTGAHTRHEQSTTQITGVFVWLDWRIHLHRTSPIVAGIPLHNAFVRILYKWLVTGSRLRRWTRHYSIIITTASTGMVGGCRLVAENLLMLLFYNMTTSH